MLTLWTDGSGCRPTLETHWIATKSINSHPKKSRTTGWDDRESIAQRSQHSRKGIEKSLMFFDNAPGRYCTDVEGMLLRYLFSRVIISLSRCPLPLLIITKSPYPLQGFVVFPALKDTSRCMAACFCRLWSSTWRTGCQTVHVCTLKACTLP